MADQDLDKKQDPEQDNPQDNSSGNGDTPPAEEKPRKMSVEDYISENGISLSVASILRHAAKGEKHTLEAWKTRANDLLNSEVH